MSNVAYRYMCINVHKVKALKHHTIVAVDSIFKFCSFFKKTHKPLYHVYYLLANWLTFYLNSLVKCLLLQP